MMACKIHELTMRTEELYAVCAHLGGSMERGHYVAFVNVGPSLQEEVLPADF